MSIPEFVLVHTAIPVSFEEPQSDPPEWIEGEPGPQGGGVAIQGAAFACVLFMPGAGGEIPNAYRTRVVREPTLLYNAERDDGTPVVVKDEMELLVRAPELAAWTGAETQRWQAVGDGQPFGPPGEVIGVLTRLRGVED